VHTFLDGSIRRVIERCQKAADSNLGIEAQDVDVLKLLYLIRYIDDVKSNLDNIVILMANDLRTDKITMRASIRSFISYAVGCMLGRYSIYKPGMIYAGGKWDDSVYENAAWIDGERPEALEFYHNSHFLPDVDGVLPICDDEYFTDDIVGKFINFVEVLFGVDTLEANLRG